MVRVVNIVGQDGIELIYYGLLCFVELGVFEFLRMSLECLCELENKEIVYVRCNNFDGLCCIK